MFGKISKGAALVVPALLLACGETSTSPDATGGNGGDVSSSSDALSSSSDAGTLPEVSSSSAGSSSSVKIEPVAPSPALDSALAALTGKLMHWVGAEDGSRIETGLDVGTNTSGYWYDYRDDYDGGGSFIKWPVELNNEYSEDALEQVVAYCDGLCGTYNLDKGTLTYDPFVGVAFDVGGEDENSYLVPVDASKWNGVCVAYTSDAPMDLEMGLGDSGDADNAYLRRSVYLKKSESPITKCFKWENFALGYGDIYNGADYADKLVSLHFRIQGKTGSTGKFNILGLSSNEVGE